MSEQQEHVVEASDDALYVETLETMLGSTENVDYGGGAWVDLYGMKDGHKVKINLTSHARTPEGALRNLIAAIGVAASEYKLTPYDPTLQASPSQAAKPATVAPVAQTAPGVPGVPAPVAVASPVPAPAAAPAAPTGTGNVMVIDTVKVLPQADGKSKVEFWNTGRKYAELSMILTPAKCAEMFSAGTGAGWTVGHFEKAGAYQTALRVTWVNSTRTNSKGEPYKNVTKIENA